MLIDKVWNSFIMQMKLVWATFMQMYLVITSFVQFELVRTRWKLQMEKADRLESTS